jgi:hypothetical protein
MKKPLRMLLLVLSLSSGIANGAETAKTSIPREEIRRLIASIPTSSNLSHYKKLLAKPETEKNREQLREVRRKIQVAEKSLPRLFALLKPGMTLREYPGLKAAGTLNSGMSNTGPNGEAVFGYWLHVGGAPLKYSETHPTEFILHVDAQGIITSVDDLVCRQ